MRGNKLMQYSFLHGAGVLVYVAIVACIIRYGNELFGKMVSTFSAMAFLLLFVLSAAVVGSLIFVKPVMLYLDGVKQDAVKLLLYTIAWIFVFLLAVLAILLFI